MEPIELTLLNNLSLAWALVWNVLVEIKLLHTIQMSHWLLHCVDLFWIAKEGILIFCVKIHDCMLNICWVENPLEGFKLFYIHLDLFDPLSHLFELINLLLHLFASEEGNFGNNTHDLRWKIILQIDNSVIYFFVASDPITCFPYLLLKGVVFEVLDSRMPKVVHFVRIWSGHTVVENPEFGTRSCRDESGGHDDLIGDNVSWNKVQKDVLEVKTSCHTES